MWAIVFAESDAATWTAIGGGIGTIAASLVAAYKIYVSGEERAKIVERDAKIADLETKFAAASLTILAKDAEIREKKRAGNTMLKTYKKTIEATETQLELIQQTLEQKTKEATEANVHIQTLEAELASLRRET